MQVKNNPINSIIPYEFNNRIHDEKQINLIANSINEFGFNQPIVIDESNVVLVGHGRLLAAQKLGLDAIPTLQLKNLTEAKKRAYRILDNKLQNDSTWNLESLDLELEALQEEGFQLEDWGLDDLLKLLPIEEPEIYEDEVPEVPEVPTETYIKENDLIELGKHKVLCANTLNQDSVDLLMQNNKAKILFTSPPYSDMRTYGVKDLDLSPETIAEFIKTWSNYSENLAVNLGLKFHQSECVTYWDPFLVVAKREELKLLAWNVWAKNHGASVANACNMFYITHEFIFVFGEQKIRLNRTVPNKEKVDTTKKDIRTVRQANGEMKKTTTAQYNSHQIHSVLNINPSATQGDHVAIFPIELPGEYIKAFTDNDDLVLDSFLGSGTTLIAAEQLGRICYGMEISPAYCQVIIERYKKHCEKVGKPFECKINGEVFNGTS